MLLLLLLLRTNFHKHSRSRPQSCCRVSVSVKSVSRILRRTTTLRPVSGVSVNDLALRKMALKLRDDRLFFLLLCCREVQGLMRYSGAMS
ncbi:hypothetical protein VTO42DRAFT_5423 [Malbranchea cinnamomea]